jgi:TRAP-type C4-dicarboxylate transport system permease small subunit
MFDAVPAWWLQSIMPLVFALIGYRYAVRAIKRARGR